MIDVSDFYNELIRNEVEFFAGVPDSLLKDICAYITDNTPSSHSFITANEGSAIALGAGYHLGSDKIPLIYLQNSGIGNAINPLMSLADKEVYAIPMILLIGWRGEPGVKDEPQHIKQGGITSALLETMGIPFYILDEKSEYKKMIENLTEKAKRLSMPVALLVRKGTFELYKLKQEVDNNNSLSREQALEQVLSLIPIDSAIVSTTGMLSRELFELRENSVQSHETDFLTVGSMGHTLQIALGIALAKPEQTVFCLDGDGSAIMHLGNYAVAGSLNPANLKVIIFNNGAHDSVGGQATVGQTINFPKVAEAVGFKSYGVVETAEEMKAILPSFVAEKSISFLEIKIKKGARKDLGRPTLSPKENKELFKQFLKK